MSSPASGPTPGTVTSSAPIAPSRESWFASREALRVREKEYSKLKDELAAARKVLPWLPAPEDFALEDCSAWTKDGEQEKNSTRISELFGCNRQLLVYDMMTFDQKRGYPCVACSHIVEQLSAVYDHLSKHASIAVICHGPPDRLRICAKLRQWKVPVYACGEEFTKFIVTEGHPRITPDWSQPASRSALSCWAKGSPDGCTSDQVYLTYATWERGVEEVEVCTAWIDRAPFVIKGARQPGFLQWRQLYGEPSPLQAHCQ